MAVKPQLLRNVLVNNTSNNLTPAFSAIIDGLKDSNDDIRAVASSSLIPISDKLVEILPDSIIFHSVVLSLWASLQELDDLTSATSFVMDLLADLVKRPAVSKIMRQESADFFEKLVPQLYPFFRHAIYSVRKAVIRTLTTLADLSHLENQNINWITIDLFRLIFQNFILEERRELIDASLELLLKIINILEMRYLNSPEGFLGMYTHSSINKLFALIMSPVGKPIDMRLLVHFSSSQQKVGSAETGLNVSPTDRAMVQQDLTIVDHSDVIFGRIAGLQTLGRLMCVMLDNAALAGLKIFDITLAYLTSAWAGHRLFAGILVEECIIWLNSKKYAKKESVDKFLGTMNQCLDEYSSGASVLYQELLSLITAVRNESVQLRTMYSSSEHPLPMIPPLPDGSDVAATDNPWGNIFTIAVADALYKSIPENISDESITVSKSRLSLLISNYKASQMKWDTQVQMCFSCAIVASGTLPAKQNPITRSLMNAIKSEENEQLQDRAARGLSSLIKINTTTEKGLISNEKIIKNLCVFLCKGPQFVGDVNTRLTGGILTIIHLKEASESKKIKNQKKKSKQLDDLDISASSAIDEAAKHDEAEALKKSLSVLHRGFFSLIIFIRS